MPALFMITVLFGGTFLPHVDATNGLSFDKSAITVEYVYKTND